MAVYQEKDKSKWTKDGRKWYFITYYTDIYGVRKRKKSKMFITKSEAQEAERDFLIETKTTSTTDYNITFKEVFDEWLLYKKTQVKSTTYYGIKKNTQKHILSYFEKFKLHSIKTNAIIFWKKNVESTIDTINYQNSMIGYLIEILNYAKDNYDFDSKIISKLHKNKVEIVKDTKSNVDLNYWTFDEYNKFIKSVDEDIYYLMFTFLYYTGLRLGEMIALTWNDINFENKTLRINKTYADKVEDDIYIITTPKTTNSNRIVDLDDNLLKLLKRHYNNEKRVYNFNKDVFVFGNHKHIAPTTFRNHLNKYISLSNVKKITPHGFRHSHVSLLINLGCDSRDVADRVGDTIEVIESTYYHMFPSKKARTVSFLNELNKKN